MEPGLFFKFAPLIRDMAEAELAAEIDQPQRLLLAGGTAGGRKVEIAYAPFDHVNREATS